MNKQILLIDNIAFAKKNERLAGELSLENCARLDEVLQSSTNSKANHSGLISYVLQGKVNAVGQQVLQLSIICELGTSCQRCLNAMPLHLNLNFNYLITDVGDTDTEAIDMDNSDDYDLQQANKAMDLIALIEDEIIMAMPIAPMHEDGCTPMTTQSGEKPNPFAVLKGLVKS